MIELIESVDLWLITLCGKYCVLVRNNILRRLRCKNIISAFLNKFDKIIRRQDTIFYREMEQKYLKCTY